MSVAIDDALWESELSPVEKFLPLIVFKVRGRWYAIDNERLFVARVLRYHGYGTYIHVQIQSICDKDVILALRKK